MITNTKIKKRLRASAPQVKDNEAFMADTIRQINLMPSPSSELQESLRRYTMLERLAMRMDAVRWLLVLCSLFLAQNSFQLLPSSK